MNYITFNNIYARKVKEEYVYECYDCYLLLLNDMIVIKRTLTRKSKTQQVTLALKMCKYYCIFCEIIKNSSFLLNLKKKGTKAASHFLKNIAFCIIISMSVRLLWLYLG